jgi:hypothetical protein
MKLRTIVRDSLYLTWALPASQVPPPPRPLRVQTHLWQGEPYVFVSVVLSRQQGLRLPGIPFLGLSYPQLNLFVHVLDSSGEPAVLVEKILAPVWLAAGMRLVTGLPVAAASFAVPSPSENPEQEAWEWRVRGEGDLAVTARRGAPRLGEGPRFASWEAMVHALRDRTATYAPTGEGLRRIDIAVSEKPAWPLAAEVEEISLVERLLPLRDRSPWPPLYAAWLDPELPILLALALAGEPELALPRRVPAPG